MPGFNLETVPTETKPGEFSHPQFQVGELVAHPVHGLCRIQKIEVADIGEGDQLYYTFLMGTTRVNAKVFVSVALASELGVRYPVTRVQAQDIVQILETAIEDPGLSWRACLEQISKTLQTGDLFCLAKLMRSACLKGTTPFGENISENYPDNYRRDQALLTRAVQRLTSELGFVLKESPGVIRKRIYKTWTKKVAHR
ncbi:MAG: hypothetical protein AUJ72_02805 [Candidatus Omnitrophica bacterium CG1_02_46_14]|nr:MAG: hypothetical protein AUJ72_02805 [Candidatus Omnitrophica bacterium CG1_02_46_14]